MNHAIVIGASMAGLLSAAALHAKFARVTVLDRDAMPDDDEHRKGVGQSRHAHALLARGHEAVERLLPGITAELVAQGAIASDVQRNARHIHCGQRHARVESGMTGLLASRPMLEGQVRRRITALPGVRLLPDSVAASLLVERDRVTRVRLAGGEPIPADLVVDASGRGSRTPFWLDELGIVPPAEEHVMLDVRYGTREFRRRPGDLDGDLIVVVAPTPDKPRGGVALAMEGDRWIVTLVGYGQAPGRSLAGFAEFAADLPALDLHRLISTAQPIGKPQVYRNPAGIRRRYERMTRFPDGLLVTGDAVCAFNPRYGQGMTVAALEALELLKTDLRPLPFFKRVAKVVDGPWQITVDDDVRLLHAASTLSLKKRLLNAYLERFHAAAAHDQELALRFQRVANLYAPPLSLITPGSLVRVLRNGSPRATSVPDPESVPREASERSTRST
ncbi:FAD-binding monooxygenase [Nonomuraea sp. NPDC048892]|uniref:FAD-dependent oxidoreductase n=1 Tax=Nonomuraea sp. NPDC048892 TaxID=3154624 RepID=UPI0033C47C0E